MLLMGRMLLKIDSDIKIKMGFLILVVIQLEIHHVEEIQVRG